MRSTLSTAVAAALLHALTYESPIAVSDSCEGLDPYNRLEECDRVIGDQPATNCVLRGWCPVEQPEFGLGYQECRRQDIPVALPEFTPEDLFDDALFPRCAVARQFAQGCETEGLCTSPVARQSRKQKH